MILRVTSVFLILIFSGHFSIALDSCERWFERTGINKNSQLCFLDCASAPIAMDTYSCPLQCADFCKYSKRVWIYFSNGVWNTKYTAEKNAHILQQRLEPAMNRYGDLLPLIANLTGIQVAYNVDGNDFDQAAQAVDQKTRSEFRHFWKWLSDLSIAPEWFRKRFAHNILSEDKSFEDHDPELREHIKQYSTHLEKGDAVLVVSHSQGNFYAHAAYRLLMAKYGVLLPMRLIPVASPEFEETSEGLLNGWPYTTLFSDGVIALIPHHLPPNTRNVPAGFFDHSFVEHYLNGSKSGPKILDDISCVVSTFRMRRPSIDSFLESDFDHKACKNLIPHPEAEKIDAEDG